MMVYDSPNLTIWLLLFDPGRWNLSQLLTRISPHMGPLIAGAHQLSGVRHAVGSRLARPPADATLANVKRDQLITALAITVEATGCPGAIFVSQAGQDDLEVASLDAESTLKITLVDDRQLYAKISDGLDDGLDLTLSGDLAHRLGQIVGLDTADWFYLKRVTQGDFTLGLLGLGIQLTQPAPVPRAMAAALGLDSTTPIGRPRLQQMQVIEQLRILSSEIGDYFERSGIREHAYVEGMIEERAHLGIDLHDSILQDLTYLQLQLGRLEESLDTDPELARDLLTKTRSVLGTASREARELSVGLTSSHISDDLVDVLDVVLERFRSRFEGEVEMQVNGSQRSAPAVLNGQLMRIFQEILNNVWKHAAATHVKVELVFERQALHLAVNDNGRGFVLDERGPGQLGLRGIENRAAQIGATFDIQSEVGKGTTVTVTVPL
jgi:signal transduction histidine kinase